MSRDLREEGKKNDRSYQHDLLIDNAKYIIKAFKEMNTLVSDGENHIRLFLQHLGFKKVYKLTDSIKETMKDNSYNPNILYDITGVFSKGYTMHYNGTFTIITEDEVRVYIRVSGDYILFDHLKVDNKEFIKELKKLK